MTLRLLLIDDAGNIASWEKPYVESLPGLPVDTSTVLWGNVALLAGEAARSLERNRRGTEPPLEESSYRHRAAGFGVK